MIDFGYKYDKISSFFKTTEGASVDVPGPGMDGGGIKGKLGIGGSTSENSFDVTLGLGVGAAVVNNNDDVVQSISLSRSEADQVASSTDVWFETWNVDKDNITDDLKSNMWYSEAYKKKADSLDE